LSALEWQLRVEEVYRSIDLPELLKQVELSKLQRRFQLAETGANSRKLDFREVPGMPPDISYATVICGMQEGRSIVPHGHPNLVSGYLIIEGNVHVRNFERLSQHSSRQHVHSLLSRSSTGAASREPTL
jgi:hypothetical protein